MVFHLYIFCFLFCFVYVIFRQVELLHLYNIYENTDEFIACVFIAYYCNSIQFCSCIKYGEGEDKCSLLKQTKDKTDSVNKCQ